MMHRPAACIAQDSGKLRQDPERDLSASMPGTAALLVARGPDLVYEYCGNGAKQGSDIPWARPPAP